MPTPGELRDPKQWLDEQGYSMDLVERRGRRLQWLKPDGSPIPNLFPADSDSVLRHMRKGWRIRPRNSLPHRHRASIGARRAHPFASVGPVQSQQVGLVLDDGHRPGRPHPATPDLPHDYLVARAPSGRLLRRHRWSRPAASRPRRAASPARRKTPPCRSPTPIRPPRGRGLLSRPWR